MTRLPGHRVSHPSALDSRIPLKNSTRLPLRTPALFLRSLWYRKNLATAMQSGGGGGAPSALALGPAIRLPLPRSVAALRDAMAWWANVAPLRYVPSFNSLIGCEP